MKAATTIYLLFVVWRRPDIFPKCLPAVSDLRRVSPSAVLNNALVKFEKTNTSAFPFVALDIGRVLSPCHRNASSIEVELVGGRRFYAATRLPEDLLQVETIVAAASEYRQADVCTQASSTRGDYCSTREAGHLPASCDLVWQEFVLSVACCH